MGPRVGTMVKEISWEPYKDYKTCTVATPTKEPYLRSVSYCLMPWANIMDSIVQ